MPVGISYQIYAGRTKIYVGIFNEKQLHSFSCGMDDTWHDDTFYCHICNVLSKKTYIEVNWDFLKIDIILKYICWNFWNLRKSTIRTISQQMRRVCELHEFYSLFIFFWFLKNFSCVQVMDIGWYLHNRGALVKH